MESIFKKEQEQIADDEYEYYVQSRNLSVVVPVYNAETKVRDTILKLKRILEHVNDNFEIILVNDGSTDNTRKVIAELAEEDERIQYLSYSPNLGKGYAVKQGILYAEGDDILFIDADGDIVPSRIASYLGELNTMDLIIASKYHPDSKVKSPLTRKFLSRGFHLLVRISLGVKVKDTQAGLKAGKKKAFKKIFEKVLVKKYAFDAEMIAVATLLNLKIKEMPVEIELDRKFKIRDIARMFIDIAGITYRLRVIKWYQRNLDRERPHYRPIIPL